MFNSQLDPFRALLVGAFLKTRQVMGDNNSVKSNNNYSKSYGNGNVNVNNAGNNSSFPGSGNASLPNMSGHQSRAPFKGNNTEQRSGSSSPFRQNSQGPRNGSCNYCKQFGHFKGECPILMAKNERARLLGREASPFRASDVPSAVPGINLIEPSLPPSPKENKPLN